MGDKGPVISRELRASAGQQATVDGTALALMQTSTTVSELAL